MILDNVKEKGLGVVEGSWHDVLVIIIDDVKIMNKELTTIIRRGATDNKLSREQNSEERWEASLRLSGMAGPSNERWEHWALKPSRPQLFSSLQTIQDSFHFSPRFLLCISLWSSRLEWQQLGYGMSHINYVFLNGISIYAILTLPDFVFAVYSRGPQWEQSKLYLLRESSRWAIRTKI